VNITKLRALLRSTRPISYLVVKSLMPKTAKFCYLVLGVIINAQASMCILYTLMLERWSIYCDLVYLTVIVRCWCEVYEVICKCEVGLLNVLQRILQLRNIKAHVTFYAVGHNYP